MFFTIRLLGTKLVSSGLFLPGIIQVIKNSVLKNIAPSVSSVWAESSPFSVVCAVIPAPGKRRGSRIQGDPLQHNPI